MARQRYMSQQLGCVVAILAAIGLFLAAGCSRDRHDRSNVGAALPTLDTLSNGLPVALARKSTEWVEMWRKAAPGFTPDSLIRAGRSSAHLGSDVPMDHSLVADTDSSLLREVMGEVSPTGRYVLIQDVYRALPDSEVENPAGGEADEAAVLVDYQRRTCDMFLVLGTPFTFDWGGWVDSTHFALAGSESDEENSCFGFVRLYSISENSVTTWNTRPAPLALRAPYYAASEERMMARCRAWKASRSRSRRGAGQVGP